MGWIYRVGSRAPGSHEPEKGEPEPWGEIRIPGSDAFSPVQFSPREGRGNPLGNRVSGYPGSE